jgi:hypothetical protein
MNVNQNVYTAIIKGDNNVSIIDWNFTKNVLYLFVLMLYNMYKQFNFVLLIYPLFFFINQHFNKQYKNTGSYYRKFFP